MVNAHLNLNCPDSLPNCGIFKPIGYVIVSVRLLQCKRHVLSEIPDEYLEWNKSYRGVKNGMLYSENAKIINMRLTISITDMKP